MTPNPFFGVLLHAIGGLAAGSFYIPFKKVRAWGWETYWLAGGFFSWIIAPMVVSMLVCPNLVGILLHAPAKALFWSYFFGMLWGIGGLTFGLSMRYLGMSLGYALALGFCAAFGTLIPPIFKGEIVGLMSKLSGQVVLLGVPVCLAGIAVCGRAGVRKENELSADQKKATISEFNFSTGVWVAIFAGVMSACMSFGIDASKPIADLATKHGTPDLWQYSPSYIVIFAGGFTVNCIWCVLLGIRNRSTRDYIDGKHSPLLVNYIFCALAGITWYLQFMFFGMGKTQMGKYDFSSWTIHMAFIIVFSSLWAIYFREWKGASRRTHQLVAIGIIVLVISTVVVGAGAYLGNNKNPVFRAALNAKRSEGGIMLSWKPAVDSEKNRITYVIQTKSAGARWSKVGETKKTSYRLGAATGVGAARVAALDGFHTLYEAPKAEISVPKQ
jgi:L-rhamnose-H+ transport protein